MSTRQTLATVVICTRDRPDDLARCLPTVLANDYPALEVIVLDQSTSDASGEVLARAVAEAAPAGWRLQATHDDVAARRVVHIRSSQVGLSRARNEAMRHALGEVVLFTDDDCTVAPDWVGRAMAVMDAEPTAAVIFGRFGAAPHDPRTSFVPAFEPEQFRRLTGARTRLGSEAGGNMAIRRAAARRLGSFDELLGAGGTFRSGEDSDYGYRALRAGYSIIHDPESLVLHWGAREYGSGAARRLLIGGCYATGAIYVRHFRRGDWLAAYRLLYELGLESGRVLSNLMSGRRPLGIRRFTSICRGIIDGLRIPIT